MGKRAQRLKNFVTEYPYTFSGLIGTLQSQVMLYYSSGRFVYEGLVIAPFYLYPLFKFELKRKINRELNERFPDLYRMSELAK